MRWAIWMALYANAHRDPQAGAYEPGEFLEQLPWRRPAEVAAEDIDTGRLRLKIEELRAAFGGMKHATG